MKLYELPEKDLPDAFIQTAYKMGIGLPIIIEKDYWLVRLLDLLFSNPKLAKYHIFKGGTSLSKGFGIIQRFSEDVDLTISKEILGFDLTIEQVATLSNKQRKHHFEQLHLAAENHVVEVLKLLKDDLKQTCSTNQWKLYIPPEDKQQIYFEYPRLLKSSMYPNEAYVQPRIILEFGARGDTTPSDAVNITTYTEQALSDVFSAHEISVTTLAPQRTFWEKITLLHMLAHQPEEKTLSLRMSRHYYDTYMLSKSNILDGALNQSGLLKQVAKHKSIYFRSRQASYDTATPGSLKLIPNKTLLNKLSIDYQAMQEMFFGELISFETIIENIDHLEARINQMELVS